MQEQVPDQNLSNRDWQNLEILNDLLFDVSEPPNRLQQALSFLVDKLGYSRAALIIQGDSEEAPHAKIFCNLAEDQQAWFDDPLSLIGQILQRVIHSRLQYPSEPGLGLAAALPLVYRSEMVGALFIFGSDIGKDDFPRWQFYLRAIARAIWSWNLSPKKSSLKQDIQVLETLFKIQKENPQDANATQHAVLEYVRDLYQAQDALLILFENGGFSLVFHKQMGLGGQWVEHRSIVSDDTRSVEMLRGSLNEAGVWQSTPDFLRWLSQISELAVSSSLCSLLKVKSRDIGALILINPAFGASEVPQVLFQLISTFLANAIQISREVTSLKISVADLEANRWEIMNSRNTLLTFFDSIPASVYIVDWNFTLISINLRRSGRLNKHPNTLVGKKCYEQLFNRVDPCPACRVFETFRAGAITNRISREWEDQDRFIEWEITTFPIQEADQLPHRVIVFEEDVTEKRNLEANLIQSEKLASVGQLAAGVAHEINNPLAAIIANAQLLKRDLPRDEQNEEFLSSVELIEMAGLRAAQVVSNLLSLARKEKKDEFEMISLNETILNSLTLVNHELKNHSIETQVDLEEDMPDLMASKNHLQGVWINMVVNSIDSMDRPNGKISIQTRYLNNEFRVIIADNGKGIPQDHLSRIFEPFFTTKVAGKGTGLGLSVCYRVIKEHQGNIVVESQPGSGTKFTVILPNLAGAGQKRSIHA